MPSVFLRRISPMGWGGALISFHHLSEQAFI